MTDLLDGEFERKGHMARIYGVPIEDCPYRGKDRKAWERGWQNADALI